MGGSENRKLLIVDDDDAVREVCREMLASLGYQTVSAASGRKAICHLKSDDYDLMLLDVAMPTMSGVEVVAEIEYQNLDLPVILMTGFSASEVTGLTQNTRLPRAVLVKPFPMQELKAAVERMFESAKPAEPAEPVEY